MQNPPPKPSTMPFSVDFVRTVAILMVIFVHASSFPYSIPGEITPLVMVNWFTSDVYGAIGYLGVPIFVMLSGALLLNPQKADEPLRAFYKKRFNRIGLPLIFWTIIFFAWNYVVHNQPLTLFNIQQGLLTGSYPIMWFLYMLAGLYLATPFLRVLTKHIDRKKFTILITLWFIGAVIAPIIHTFTLFDYNPVMFVFSDWAGYFLLGAFLIQSKIHRAVVYPVLAFGFFVAVAGFLDRNLNGRGNSNRLLPRLPQLQHDSGVSRAVPNLSQHTPGAHRKRQRHRQPLDALDWTKHAAVLPASHYSFGDYSNWALGLALPIHGHSLS